jgi:DNA-binding transcriptional LysR family regulator
MNLRRLDLNLLVVFDALMVDANVTKAANRIGLSQPAMSNALNRLRAFADDDLFVRTPDGMRPTAKALEMAPAVRSGLSSIERALEPAEFDPSTAQRTIRIDTNDYVVTTLLPRLIPVLEREAPGIDLQVFPQTGRTFERLDAQEVDFGVSSYGTLAERFDSGVLARDDYVVLMRPRHPLAGANLTVARYAAATHLLVSPRGDSVGFVDAALAERGFTRRVALTINQFSAAPAIVAACDLVVTLPRRVAEQLGSYFKLVQKPCPVAAPDAFSVVSIVWHRRFGLNPALEWFRDRAIQVGRASQARS